MRIVTNTKLAKRNRQWATYLFLGTFVLLFGGFIFININFFTEDIAIDDPVLLLLQSLVLPIAFLLTLFSVRMTNLWARQPYPEKVLDDGLKGLSKKSVLYNYYHLPVRHVLICPQGVFAIVTRWHTDTYTIENDRWKSNKNAFSRLAGVLLMNNIGDPSADAQQAAARVQKTLQEIAPDVTVQPLVVMIDSAATLEIEGENTVPVVYADSKKSPNLTEYLRSVNRSENGNRSSSKLPLTDEQIEAFEDASF